jgi:hypothetical protein
MERERDNWRRKSEDMLERYKNALEDIEDGIADKSRLDALESVSCWIGIEDDECHPKARWAAGGVYTFSVREIADFYLENADVDARRAGARNQTGG